MDKDLQDKLIAAAASLRPALVGFAQRLVQTPSLPGHEGDVARLAAEEMKRLAYDEVEIDEVGNVIGRIKGAGDRLRLFNGHMDHVEAGSSSAWAHPPFGGEIIDGELWGRGAVDMKGGLAAMIYAGGVLRQAGVTPPGDLLVAGVVMEETGGIGTRRLLKTHRAAWGLVGEPSGNGLRRGHRGRFEFQAVVHGRAAHASVPEQAVNPHYIIADFLKKLAAYSPLVHPVLGRASVAPTSYRLDPYMANIIPGEVTLTIDYRSLPGQQPAEIRQVLADMLAQCLPAGASAEVELTILSARTYTGLATRDEAIFPAFILPEENPLVLAAGQALEDVWGERPPVSVWRFATDGGHMTAASIPTIGLGPGDERLAHTNEERLSLEQLQSALLGYSALAMLEVT